MDEKFEWSLSRKFRTTLDVRRGFRPVSIALAITGDIPMDGLNPKWIDDVSRIHRVSGKLECQICYTQFTQFNNLKSHLLEHEHAKQLDSDSPIANENIADNVGVKNENDLENSNLLDEHKFPVKDEQSKMPQINSDKSRIKNKICEKNQVIVEGTIPEKRKIYDTPLIQEN